jgi:hypothetical protein
VVESLVGVHLHLQQHHREVAAADIAAAGAFPGPEHIVEAMAVTMFDRVKAKGIVDGARSGQQSADQVWGALEDAIGPADGVQQQQRWLAAGVLGWSQLRSAHPVSSNPVAGVQYVL